MAMRSVTTTFVASDRLNSEPFHICKVWANALCRCFALAKYTVCVKPQTENAMSNDRNGSITWEGRTS